MASESESINKKSEKIFLKSNIFKAIVLITVIVIVWKVWDVFALLILALAIASALSGPVDYFQKRRWPRLLAAIVLYIIFASCVILVSVFVIPSFARQLIDVGKELPILYERALNLSNFFNRFGIEVFSADQVREYFSGLSDRILGSVLSFFNALASVFVVVVLSFYLLVRKDGVSDFIRLLVPIKYESRALSIWEKTNLKLGRWLQGQLLLGVIVGVLVYIGLKILGVPYALALAVLAGFLELIPYVGPIFSAVPAVIYGFLHSATLGLSLIVFYTLVQQLENHLIVPIVNKKMVDLNPIIVILALIIAGKLGGILGFLVAIPIAVMLAEILEELSARKRIA